MTDFHLNGNSSDDAALLGFIKNSRVLSLNDYFNLKYTTIDVIIKILILKIEVPSKTFILVMKRLSFIVSFVLLLTVCAIWIAIEYGSIVSLCLLRISYSLDPRKMLFVLGIQVSFNILYSKSKVLLDIFFSII